MVTIESRSEAAAAKKGNVYTKRPVCTCGYKGKWTNLGHAEDLATAHNCNR